ELSRTGRSHDDSLPDDAADDGLVPRLSSRAGTLHPSLGAGDDDGMEARRPPERARSRARSAVSRPFGDDMHRLSQVAVMTQDDRRASLERYLRLLEADDVSRRDFVKLLGASAALAGIDAWTRMPSDRILPDVTQPELTPGISTHYATAMVVDGYA